MTRHLAVVALSGGQATAGASTRAAQGMTRPPCPDMLRGRPTATGDGAKALFSMSRGVAGSQGQQRSSRPAVRRRFWLWQVQHRLTGDKP